MSVPVHELSVALEKLSVSPLTFLHLPKEVSDRRHYRLRSPRHRCANSWNVICWRALGFAPKFDRAILSVNRQIHHEASEIFFYYKPLMIWVSGLDMWQMWNREFERLIETLAKSSSRPYMKQFVLNVAIECDQGELYDHDVNHNYQTAVRELAMAIDLVAQGPMIKSLKVRFQPLNNSGGGWSERSKFPMEVLAVFGPLHGRVSHVTVEPTWGREKLPQLHGLRQMLQVLDRQRTSFLGLPFDIRQICYSHMVTHDSVPQPPCRDVKWNDHLFWGSPASTFPVAFFRTCRQVHDEATLYFYSRISQPLIVPYWWPRVQWTRVGNSYLHHVRHYDIAVIEDDNDGVQYEELSEVVSELCKGPRVKSLRIRTAVNHSRTHRATSTPPTALDAFSALANHVDKIILGPLLVRKDRITNSEMAWERDELCYRHLREILAGPAKWEVPYPAGERKRKAKELK